jgi:SnoaL-like domain
MISMSQFGIGNLDSDFPPSNDRTQLVDLISGYAHAVDRRDVSRIVACFADEAIMEHESGEATSAHGPGHGVLHGAEEIRHFFEIAFTRGALQQGSTSTHILTNTLVAPTDSGAHLETHAIACLAGAGFRVVILRGLRYSDDCAKIDGKWVIQHRVHSALWQCESPGHVL